MARPCVGAARAPELPPVGGVYNDRGGSSTPLGTFRSLRLTAFPNENTAMHTRLNVALAQYMSGCDPARIASEARAAGAEVVVFPEMYSNGYARFDPTAID